MAKRHWRGQQAKSFIDETLAENMTKAGRFAVSAIKDDLDSQVSVPGRPPAEKSGKLKRSIAFEIDKPNLEMVVGTNLEYAKYLELGTSKMEARPFLRPSIRKNLTAILRRLAGQR